MKQQCVYTSFLVAYLQGSALECCTSSASSHSSFSGSSLGGT